jgi:hypothetical protein
VHIVSSASSAAKTSRKGVVLMCRHHKDLMAGRELMMERSVHF